MKSSDDPKSYDRKPLSNYEGYKRLDKSFEKLEGEDRRREKVCDVCQRRCRAWRIVPASFGAVMFQTGPFAGRKFVLCCDAGPDACSKKLERMGVHREAIAEHEVMERLGLMRVQPKRPKIIAPPIPVRVPIRGLS